MIYVIGRADDRWKKHPIKIGYTGGFSADSRLAGVQTGNPHKLKVLATADGDRISEKTLHRLFRGARLNGEWFQTSNLPADFLKAINTNQLSLFVEQAVAFEKNREKEARSLVQPREEEAYQNLVKLKEITDVSKALCWNVHWEAGDILVSRDLKDGIDLVLDEVRSLSSKLNGFASIEDGIEYSALDLFEQEIRKKRSTLDHFILNEALTKGFFNCEIIAADGDIVPGLLVQNYWVDMETGKIQTKNFPSAVMEPDFSLSIELYAMPPRCYEDKTYSTDPS